MLRCVSKSFFLQELSPPSPRPSSHQEGPTRTRPRSKAGVGGGQDGSDGEGPSRIRAIGAGRGEGTCEGGGSRLAVLDELAVGAKAHHSSNGCRHRDRVGDAEGEGGRGEGDSGGGRACGDGDGGDGGGFSQVVIVTGLGGSDGARADPGGGKARSGDGADASRSTRGDEIADGAVALSS